MAHPPPSRLLLDLGDGRALAVEGGTSVAVLCRDAERLVRLRAEWSRRTMRERLAVLSGRAPKLRIRETPAVPEAGSVTICLTADASSIEEAGRVVIVRGSRVVVDGTPGALLAGCRRIRYRNEAIEERATYGEELSAFFALQVKVRGWGIEAIVSDFDAAAFERFASLEGVVDAEASPLTLAELLEAVG